jgi:hypothetical protein
MNRTPASRKKRTGSNMIRGNNAALAKPTSSEKNTMVSTTGDTGSGGGGGGGGGGDSPMEKGGGEGKKPSMSWLTIAGSAIALVSVLASMFGYGVVFGIVQRFGQSQETFVNSPFDLVAMVWPGVLMFMTSLSRVLSWELVVVAYEQAKLPLMVLGAIVFIGMLAFMGLKQKYANPTAIITGVKKFFQSDRGLLRKAFLSLAASFAAMLAALAVQIFSAFAIVTLFVIAIYIPALGAVSGSAYVEKFVISPSECTPLVRQSTPISNSSRENESKREDKNVDSVSCVLINAVDPSKPFYRAGRLVLASSTAMLLWNAETGTVSRVPLAGMDVSSLSNEQLATANKLLAQYPADCLTMQAGSGSLVVKGGKSAADHCSR